MVSVTWHGQHRTSAAPCIGSSFWRHCARRQRRYRGLTAIGWHSPRSLALQRRYRFRIRCAHRVNNRGQGIVESAELGVPSLKALRLGNSLHTEKLALFLYRGLCPQMASTPVSSSPHQPVFVQGNDDKGTLHHALCALLSVGCKRPLHSPWWPRPGQSAARQIRYPFQSSIVEDTVIVPPVVCDPKHAERDP